MKAQGVDAPLARRPTERDAADPPSKPGSGFGHGFTAGLNSRLGARERLLSSVPPGSEGVLNLRGCLRAAASGSESGTADFVCVKRVRSGFTNVPTPPLWGRWAPWSLGSLPKRTMPHVRKVAEATRVKNEGAYPHRNARTYPTEAGSDDVTFCHLAPGRWWAHSVINY
jgi:hypothetical protein